MFSPNDYFFVSNLNFTLLCTNFPNFFTLKFQPERFPRLLDQGLLDLDLRMSEETFNLNKN